MHFTDISKGEIWRALRKNLSPTFATGKLKTMLKPMDFVAEKLVETVAKEMMENKVDRLKQVEDKFNNLSRNNLGYESCRKYLVLKL